jgi:hypothetical protein
VSTPDLLEILPNATWLPNPIDTERFKPSKTHDGNKVLYFPHWYEDLTEKIKRICEKLNYDLTVPRSYSVPYEKMHLFLNEFDVFVDQLSIKSYSKTALEAMACGLHVVGHLHDLDAIMKNLTLPLERKKLVKWQNENILPSHRVEAVVEKLVSIYNDIVTS